MEDFECGVQLPLGWDSFTLSFFPWQHTRRLARVWNHTRWPWMIDCNCIDCNPSNHGSKVSALSIRKPFFENLPLKEGINKGSTPKYIYSNYVFSRIKHSCISWRIHWIIVKFKFTEQIFIKNKIKRITDIIWEKMFWVFLLSSSIISTNQNRVLMVDILNLCLF